MVDSRIKFRHLQTFVEVARQKSVMKAADLLHVSQPAVTKTIRELEEVLGVAVFERDGRGIKITRYGEVFLRNVLASGVIPQISVIMGPCAGGDVYSPAMTDFIFMVKDTSYMFVTGPDVVKTVTNETVTAEELGGARVHTTKSSIADRAYENDVEALLQMRRLMDFLPSNNKSGVPELPTRDGPDREDASLDTLVPDNPNKPYDIKELIGKVADEGDFFEIQETYARNIVTGFARMEGRTVGIIANQPMVAAGMIDVASSEKAAHFVAVCDAFGLPLVYLIDVPGNAIGSAAERAGLGRRSGRMLFELGCATVPRLSVVLRRGYGGAFIMMNGGQPSFGAEACLIWPTAEICAMLRSSATSGGLLSNS